MRCKSLNINCKQCGWKQYDKKNDTCPQCGAEMRCGRNAVAGYPFCANHGGPAPSRNFYGRGTMTGGGSSSFQLTRLAAKYNQQKTDGVVLSNRAAIDVIDIRITQLLERVELGEAPDRVKRLYKLWNEFKDIQVGTTDYLIIRKELDDTFEKVFHDYAAWSQIFEALDLRGKSVEREVNALTKIRAVMTAEDGYQLAAKMLAAVIRVIGDDPKKIKQAQYEFSRIIGESSDHATEGFNEDVGGGGETIGGEARSGDVDQTELLYPGDEK